MWKQTRAQFDTQSSDLHDAILFFKVVFHRSVQRLKKTMQILFEFEHTFVVFTLHLLHYIA